MKTRVLCVIMTEFFEGGGLSTVMLNYYRQFWKDSALASQISIDFLSNNEIADELRSEIELHGCHYFRMTPRRTNLFKHYQDVLKVVKSGDYDTIHFNCNSGMDAIEIALSRKYVPNRICHVHNAKPSYPLLHRLLKSLLNRSYTVAIATSERAGKWLYGDSDFIVLNNAIDVQKFGYCSETRQRMREDLGIEENDFCIGNVGRMNRDNAKNHGFLLRSFALICKKQPDAKLVIVGDGELKKDWVALAHELGVEDSVTFAGFRTNVADYMQAFDVFCFPSSWEGLGMVAIEAQAAGLPVLASNAVPAEVRLTERLTFLGIDEGDEENWAQEVVALSGGRDDREAMREQTQESIRNGGYDIAVEAKRLANLYCRFLGR